MVPYYITKFTNFPIDTLSFSTNPQQRLDEAIDGTTGITFTRRQTQELSHYIKYDLTGEVLTKQKGRAYGKHELFNQCILLEEDTFYMPHNKDFLIVSASKEMFLKFVKDVNSLKQDSFRLNTIDVDFESIISNQHSSGVLGIWLGKLPDIEINALGMMGNKLETSTQYRELRNKGATITNLTIVFEYLGQQEKIMITKNGGIILYSAMDESDALPFITSVHETLFK